MLLGGPRVLGRWLNGFRSELRIGANRIIADLNNSTLKTASMVAKMMAGFETVVKKNNPALLCLCDW